jgi:hypothetical protein
LLRYANYVDSNFFEYDSPLSLSHKRPSEIPRSKKANTRNPNAKLIANQYFFFVTVMLIQFFLGGGVIACVIVSSVAKISEEHTTSIFRNDWGHLEAEDGGSIFIGIVDNMAHFQKVR